MRTNRLATDKQFSEIYIAYFPKMVRFAREYVYSEDEAKNIVQDLFLYLWECHDTLSSISNLNAFLFTLTKNRCIDYYRHFKRFDDKKESLDNVQERELHLKLQALREFDVDVFTTHEIEILLDTAIQNLPDKCRQVFILSRMEGLKHEEISQKLNISVHTVQNHIATAIRKLKIELKDYLPFFLFIF